MGSGQFAVPVLTKLLEPGGFDRRVVAVVTQPDRPNGRRQLVRRGAVAGLSDQAGAAVFQPESLKDETTVAQLADLRPDTIVVASYGLFLPRRVLNLPARPSLNIHPSLLPRFRGPSPVAAAILAGDVESGVTIMEMAPKMDAGPIVAQRRLPISPDDTTESLTAKLADAGADVLLQTLPGWLDGSVIGQPQRNEDATYTSLLSKELARVQWTKPAADLAREVRAFIPWPVAHANLGAPLRIWRATVRSSSSQCEPGTVLSADSGGITVQTGVDALLLEEVQPAGGKRMPAGAYVLGRPGLARTKAG